MSLADLRLEAHVEESEMLEPRGMLAWLVNLSMVEFCSQMDTAAENRVKYIRIGNLY